MSCPCTTDRSPAPGRSVADPPANQREQRHHNPLWHSLALGVRPKLTLSGSEDAAEREADHVADAIDGEESAQPIADSTPLGASDGVSGALSGGDPLSADDARFFGSRLGFDFRGVRIHADRSADASARSIGARAFTLGTHIAFARGEFDPRSDRGRRLLGHELTHVVQQQRAGSPSIQRSPDPRTDVKVPVVRPIGQPLVPPDPRQYTDEQIYAPLKELEQRDAEEAEGVRRAQRERLKEKTKGWGADQEFALDLLDFVTQENLYPDPRGVSDAIREPIVSRYEVWMRAVDDKLKIACDAMKKVEGLMGVILTTQANAHPSQNPCRRWFADEYSHGPTELQNLRSSLLITRGGARDAVEEIYWAVFEYRKNTDPSMLQQKEIAAGITGAMTGLTLARGGPGLATDLELLLARGEYAGLTVEGVAFGEVRVLRQGETLVVEYTYIQNVGRVPGQGRAMQINLEEAAVQAARAQGVANAEVRVYSVVNPRWAQFLESRGYAKGEVRHSGGLSFPYTKTMATGQ
jgi:Domain of unknown function (DUF4157)